MTALTAAWASLAISPLFSLALTLLAYQLALSIFHRSGQRAWANPALLAILLITAVLQLAQIPYATYFAGAQIIHFLLGPATVALAVPLFAYGRRLKRQAIPILLALLAGSATAAGSAMLIAKLLGASPVTVLSLAPKSVTTPIAMGVAEAIGGAPALAAVFVILTGIFGATCFPTVFRGLRIHDPAAQGLAVGVTSHGLGTARAFLFSEEMGAFAALAMGLNGLLTAVALPLLLH